MYKIGEYQPVQVNMQFHLSGRRSWTKNHLLLIQQHGNGPYKVLQPGAHPLHACMEMNKRPWTLHLRKQIFQEYMFCFWSILRDPSGEIDGRRLQDHHDIGDQDIDIHMYAKIYIEPQVI